MSRVPDEGRVDGEFNQPTLPAAFEQAAPHDVHVPLERGTMLAGRFEIEASLGHGGAGVVYAARDRLIGEDVAIKVLHARLRANDAQLGHLRAEVRAARRIAHPNVCRVHDLCEAGGLVFVVMEHVRGETLRKRIARGFELRDALNAARQLAAGLAAAHRAGVIHCDVKPENAIVTHDRVVLTDFGVARLVDQERSVTRSGRSSQHTFSAAEGTPSYMAPEQILGEPVDERTDVYGLAALIFELLVGRPPFGFPVEGQKISVLFGRILKEQPAFADGEPAGATAHAQQALAEALAMGLAKDPENRTESVDALIATVMSAASIGGVDLTIGTLPQPPANTPLTPTANSTHDGFSSSDGAGLAARRSLRPRGTRRITTVVHVRTVENFGELDDYGDEDEEDTADRAEAILGGAALTLTDAGGIVVGQGPQSLTAVFGAVTSRGNEPQRAADAARAIAVSAGAAGGVSAKVGIDIGRLLVRRSRKTGPPAVSGDALARAESLAISAKSGEVRASQRTARHLAERFTLRPADDSEAVCVAGVLSARDVMQLPPIIGRDREVELLSVELTRTANDGKPRAVLVLGSVGIGKSRLRREITDLMIRRAGFAVLVVSARPNDELSSHSVVRALLRDMLGLGEQVNPDEARRAAKRSMRRAGQETDKILVDALAALLAGQSVDSGLPALAAARIAFATSARKKRLLIVVDDAHWADDATLDLLEALARGEIEAPIALYVSARPGIVERRPQFRPSFRVPIDLAPLRAEHATDLARRHLARGGDEKATPEKVHALVEAADGNPFFLEELSRDAVERGDAALSGTPATIEATIQARLDRLDENSRDVLRGAAVLGRKFGQSDLEALMADSAPFGIDVSASLAELKRRQIVFPLPPDSHADDLYTIKHALVRDVAYGELPPVTRRKLHGGAATLLRARVKGKSESVEQLVDLGLHLRGAEKHGEAAEAYRRAGDLSRAQSATSEAYRCYSVCKELLGDEADVELILQLGETGIAIGEFDQVHAMLNLLVEPALADGRKRDAARALLSLATGASKRGQWEDSVATLRRALTLVEGSSDFVLAAKVYCALGWVLGYVMGETDEGIAQCLRGVSLLEGTPDLAELAHAYGRLGAAYMRAGRWRDQLGCNRRNLEIGEQLSSIRERSSAHLNLGVNLHCLGEFEESLHQSRRALTLEERMCETPNVGLVRNNVALALIELERYDECEKELNEAMRVSDICGGLYFFVEALQTKSRLAARRGQLDEAKHIAEQAVSEATDRGGAIDIGLSRKVLGAVLSRRGEHDGAARELDSAEEILRGKDLGEHARVLAERSRALTRHGRLDDAARERDAARAALEALDARSDLLRLEDLSWI